MVSVGEILRIKVPCTLAENEDCESFRYAPILQFGSLFVNEKILPSMKPMPMATKPHITSFNEYEIGGDSRV